MDYSYWNRCINIQSWLLQISAMYVALSAASFFTTVQLFLHGGFCESNALYVVPPLLQGTLSYWQQSHRCNNSPVM